ncbi:hypothetical protein PLCT2_01474 [Planctomycetaceae bacterium]|nr:hypothetical protein PLCT2_01474 [Planctomycetaceae bacterium]
MSEFDNRESPVTDPQTRLKFERYVFFAFFAVMVMVVIAGILGLKRSQQSLEVAQEESGLRQQAVDTMRERSQSERNDLNENLEGLRRRLAAAEEREAKSALQLGTALTQLAMHESGGGPAARARARLMLEEATRLGAPPYLDLARWALLDASSPAMAPIERSPFTCAALSRDGRYLALGRGERGIDLYLLGTGRRLANWPNPEGAGEATSLAFAPNKLFAGYRGGQLASVPLPAGTEYAPTVLVFTKLPATVRLLSVSELGQFLAVADAANNLYAASVESPEKAILEFRSESQVLAVAASNSPERPLIALLNSGRVIRLGTNNVRDEVVIARNSAEISSGALAVIGNSLFSAWYWKEGRSICARGPTWNGGEINASGDEPAVLEFARDGTLMVGDKSGRYHELFGFGDSLDSGQSMGSDSPIRFLARTNTAIVAVSADGTVSLRHDPDAAHFGRRILRCTSRAFPTSLGVGVASEGLVWPIETRNWVATDACSKVAATRTGFAAFGANVARLDNGAQCNAEVLFCALASGGALVRGMTGDVGVLKRDGTLQVIGALARLAPDFVCAAAGKDVVLARTGNNALVIRLDNGVTTREIFAPGMPMLGAIDDQGKRVALPDRDIIRILNLEAESETQASPKAEIASLAFLFDGSVLCALEGKELAFYDSASGRELLRRPTKALSMSGSADRLFLFCENEVRELRFN